jgi:hypothetical protein
LKHHLLDRRLLEALNLNADRVLPHGKVWNAEFAALIGDARPYQAGAVVSHPDGGSGHHAPVASATVMLIVPVATWVFPVTGKKWKMCAQQAHAPQESH